MSGIGGIGDREAAKTKETFTWASFYFNSELLQLFLTWFNFFLSSFLSSLTYLFFSVLFLFSCWSAHARNPKTVRRNRSWDWDQDQEPYQLPTHTSIIYILNTEYLLLSWWFAKLHACPLARSHSSLTRSLSYSFSFILMRGLPSKKYNNKRIISPNSINRIDTLNSACFFSFSYSHSHSSDQSSPIRCSPLHILAINFIAGS